ncbi:MAG: hypothetical protein IKN17_02350 [Ruminococcus sp.]|nr:hypothetical protein [Ruminococcus sp.]
MASRMIHLAIASRVAREYEPADRERFFFGSVLPDSGQDKAGHFFKFIKNGTRKTYDLAGFRQRYPQYRRDPLYLGYYFHLIEDIVHRNYMYGDIGIDPRPEGFVIQLHRDYTLINPAIIQKYELKPLSVPEDIDSEPIVRDHGLRPHQFAEEMRGDFLTQDTGKPLIFTEQNAFELIEKAAAVCLEELRAIAGEGEHFDEDAHSWFRH